VSPHEGASLDIHHLYIQHLNMDKYIRTYSLIDNRRSGGFLVVALATHKGRRLVGGDDVYFRLFVVDRDNGHN
jgi:hypothetical protein